MTHQTCSQLTDEDAARFLTQVFEYRRLHKGKTVVVKASGKIIDNPELLTSFADQVTTMRRDLGLKVIVAHGAGKQIDALLKDAGYTSRKENGLRISEAEHIDIINTATKQANKKLCDAFKAVSEDHITPVGLQGHHADLNMHAAAFDAANNNYSGESVLGFNKWYLTHLLSDKKNIPIITNMCAHSDATSPVKMINVNADGIASALAIGMQAHRLLLCSDVAGVLNASKQIIPEIKPQDVSKLEADRVISRRHAGKSDGSI
jgi:acetylglutamate kinase